MSSKIMKAVLTLTLIAITLAPALILGGYPPSNCCPNKYPFLPAPPGHTPPCSKNGATFCEKVEAYPLDTIRYLLYKWGSTYSQFIHTELNQEFIMMTQNVSFYPKTPNHGYGQPTNHFVHNNSHHQTNFYLPQGPPLQQYQQQQQDPYHLHAAAALIPPIVHSFWWSHRDKTTNRPSYPYLAQHRFHRFKRQTSGENQLCPVSQRFIVPQAAMNNQGNWMYVVNMEDTRYRQEVRTEMCDGVDGAPCDGICSIPPGYRASCRQKYVQKRLVALEESGAGLRGEVFWFPHCCVCEVVRG